MAVSREDPVTPCVIYIRNLSVSSVHFLFSCPAVLPQVHQLFLHSLLPQQFLPHLPLLLHHLHKPLQPLPWKVQMVPGLKQ